MVAEGLTRRGGNGAVGRFLCCDHRRLSFRSPVGQTLVRVAQLQLEHLGYEVVVHTASQDALEVFRAAPDEFILVITDQTMPAMTGKMLVEELRRIRSDIPIILCTGFSHLINDEQAQALGVDAFMMKPMATQELAATIKRVLDKHAEQESENIKRPSQTG